MQWCIRIYGTRGRAELHEQDTLIVTLDGKVSETHRYAGYDYPALRSIGDCLEDFAVSVLEDKPFSISPQEILHCTEVLDAVIRSSDQGGTINL